MIRQRIIITRSSVDVRKTGNRRPVSGRRLMLHPGGFNGSFFLFTCGASMGIQERDAAGFLFYFRPFSAPWDTDPTEWERP